MLIANYIKGREAYTTYRNHTSRQRQFKTAFHRVASFHPHYLTFSPQIYHHPVHPEPPGSGHGLRRRHHHHIHIHTSTSAAKKYIQPYLHIVFAWTKQKSHTKSRQNNLHSVHTGPCRIYEQSDLTVHNNVLPMTTYPKVAAHTSTTSQYTHTNLYKS